VLVHWPPGVRDYLPETTDVIAQNTKSGVAPRNYVALFGDSYAEGMGDWLIDNFADPNLPFSAANIIHDSLQRDVASFGREDLGSAEAMVRLPTHILEGSKCAMFPQFDDPTDIVIYFYEGNDIRDNLVFLIKVKAAYGATGAAQIDRYLSEEYATFALWRCHLHLMDTIGRMGKLYYRLLRYGKKFEEVNAYHANSIVIGDKLVSAPHLEGPGLDATDQQLVAAAGVFDRSLAWSLRRFPRARVISVYIAAPLSVYRFADDNVFVWSRKLVGDALPFGKAPFAQVERNNTRLCELIRDASKEHGVEFVNTTPAFRAAASKQPIHGPQDWHHLNRAGQILLGTLVADRLKRGGAPSDTECARR
jgi:hypothetical protein